MALSPEALDALVQGGASAAMIAAVVKADLQAEADAATAAVEARRARAAEAKRKQRAELREMAKVLQSPRDLNGQMRTSEDNEGLGSSPPNPPHTPPITPTPPTSLRSETQRARGAADGWFTELWNVYPKRPGNPRQTAEDKFCRLLKSAKDPEALALEIIDGARRYAEARAGEDPQYTTQTITWLNQGRWKDDHSRPTAPPTNGGPRGGNGHSRKPTLGDLARGDLFRSEPDGSRDCDPHEYRTDASDARVPGSAGRLLEQDRNDPRWNVTDFRRANG